MPSLDMLERFARYQKQRNLSPNTIDLRDRQLKLFLKESPGVELNGATKEQINTFLDNRRTSAGEPISAKTRSCYLTTFSSFYDWAIDEKFLKENPITKSMRPKVKPGMPNPIPEKALEKAIAQTYELQSTRANPDRGAQMRAWIYLMGYGGLRCMEVAKFAVEDVDLERNLIRVLGKGEKMRSVPLHPKIKAALEELSWVPESGRYFPTATPASVSQKTNRYLHGMGIKYTAHKGRHRFLTRFYKSSGKDILLTQRVAGHSSPQTTAGYADVDEEEAQSAILAL